MVVASRGLSRVEEIYQDRPRRARELRAAGKQVFGYLCIYPVLEMLAAADVVPYRILGDMDEPITKADACLPAVVCPFLRSVMDLGLKDKYDFLGGVVMGHACEVAEKMSHIWRTYMKPRYAYYIDTPHTTHEAAVRQHKALLEDFRASLEEFTGQKLTTAKLKAAVETYNNQRALVRELYDLRKPDPPLISGSENLKVMVALMSLPAAEGTELLKQVIAEVKERKNGPAVKPVRLLVWGSIIDNIDLVDMIESLGANVVMDDTCVGSRAYFADVKPTPDPLDGLAYRYLVELKCPRTYRQAKTAGITKRDYLADLASRFGYLKDYARDWKCSGVILQAMRFCDIHGYEVPGLREYLDSVSLPNIYLEHDYSQAALSQLRTRMQAFLEVLG